MARHRRSGPPREVFIPSQEGQETLHSDLPGVVKAAVLLASRGGRLLPEICLGCGRRGATYREIFVPATLRSPLPALGAKPVAYQACAQCRERLTDADIAQRLASRQRQARGKQGGKHGKPRRL